MLRHTPGEGGFVLLFMVNGTWFPGSTALAKSVARSALTDMTMDNRVGREQLVVFVVNDLLECFKGKSNVRRVNGLHCGFEESGSFVSGTVLAVSGCRSIAGNANARK